MKTRIGVLTSGGDCPGLNAVLRGVVRAAANRDWEVIGFHDGYEGLLTPHHSEILDVRRTAGIMQLGGTILGTTNRGHFVAKVGEGTRARIPSEIIDQARDTLRELSIHALVAIGGDGSLSTALQLHEEGIPVIGVPKTIDNDLEATAMTFGFDSAVACVADALDRLHTTASSHKRAMVIEVMGRHAGWIALYGGLAGGADIILIPEIPFDHEKIAETVRKRDADHCLSTMIVAAEGACPKEGHEQIRAMAVGEYRLGGIGEIIAGEVAARTEKETRTCVLGHLQRGGPPTTLDRILGTRFGVRAVELVAEQQFGQMVSYQNYQVLSVPISDAVHRLKLVPPEGQMVQTCRAVGIAFGD
jgi:phosphofructokinase-like protein